LLTSTKFVGSVVIPNRGFFIFGGEDSNLTYSQNLKSIYGVGGLVHHSLKTKLLLITALFR
jgi:hypothetical protein